MTALFAAEMARINLKVEDGRPFLECPPGKRPNPALMAAIRENRAGILALLGGSRTRPPNRRGAPLVLLRPAREVCDTCHACAHPEHGAYIALLTRPES